MKKLKVFTLEKLLILISFDEKFIIKNFDDDFEEDSYEKEIKNNFANSIYNKLVSYILQTQ